MHLHLVSTFRLNKHSFETFQRLHLQTYKHSDAFCYEIKKYTSCAIHMHSGKSYNPVSCERAQVTPLICPPPIPHPTSSVLTEAPSNPPLWHTHSNVQKKKKNKLRIEDLRNLCSTHSWLMTWSWTSGSLEMCFFFFFFFFTGIGVTMYTELLTLIWSSVAFKNWNLYSSRSRLCIVCL